MTVRVGIGKQFIEVTAGLSLFDCAERLGIPITNSCYKQGTCRECLVEILAGIERLSPRSEEEQHLRGDYRLACRARLLDSSDVVRFRPLRRGAVRILDHGEELPGVRDGAPIDPAITRDGQTVLLDGQPIDETAGPLHGLAVDAGTTTVVVRLVDLETAEVRATQSFENPQCFAGSEIMARIAYSPSDHDELLQKTLIAYINQAIMAFPCQVNSIYEVVVAGNSTMRDLFFGLDVRSLGQSPYRSPTEHELVTGQRSTTRIAASARDLGLCTNSKARAYGLPLVGGHVGADAAACLLAIDAANEDRLIALMDIGTNTELLVGNRGRMLAASCPAGPAFEGGLVNCGMPAFPGAIETVEIDSDGSVRCRIIGDGAAQGICGSGLVDVLAELLRSQRMNTLGRLGRDRFVIDRDADVYLTEEDISQLAQAKAAQAAGWALVMNHYGVRFDELERLYLAGGFASSLDVGAAQRIGLIPPVPRQRIRQVGNAAIEGATLALLSSTMRARLESFVLGIAHIELETDADFFDTFVEGCQFKPLRQSSKGDA